MGEIQKKPQEAVCPPDQGDLHQVGIVEIVEMVEVVVGFPQMLVSPQARQNYHWKPLPDMQRRIFGLGLQVHILHLLAKVIIFSFHQKCEAAATLHRPLHWPNPSNSKDKPLSETVQAARH